MRPDRDQALDRAPLSDLLAILLRQHKRLLAQRGIELSESQIEDLAQQMDGQVLPAERADFLRQALVDIVEESAAVLNRWNLSFAESLRTDMDEMPGWETTSEFLEIANEKGNAELRIASGAALLAALGDVRYAGDLLAAIAHDPHEIETVTARRVLSNLSGIDPAVSDWPAQIERWLESGGS